MLQSRALAGHLLSSPWFSSQALPSGVADGSQYLQSCILQGYSCQLQHPGREQGCSHWLTRASQAPVPEAACAVTPAEWVWHRVGTRGSLRGSLDALTREEADTTQEDRAHPTKGLGLPGDPAAMPSSCAAGGGPSLAEHCASWSTCSSRVRAGCASPPCPCGH